MAVGHIDIFKAIGTDRGEISFDNVREQLQAVKDADELALHILSPGGDVFEGEAIYNLLKNSGKKITTYVEGTCASIATLIAAAGDEVIMNTTSRWMVHNPKISGLQTSADARDLRHVANQLDKIKTLLIDVWDKRTTIGKEKLWELYDNETWLTAAEAKAMGFADRVEDGIKAVAYVNLKNYKMKNTKPNWFKTVLNLLKIKNEYTETLADGTVIIVLSDTEDWTGKQVITEDGSPLPPGDYEMADGKVLSIGDGGMISTVSDPDPEDKQEEAKEEQPTENEMKELETLKAQLAEANAKLAAVEAEKETAKAEAVTAKQSAVKFENRLKVIEDVLEKAGQTVGDKTPVKVAVPKMINKDQQSDPMGDFALNFYKKRGIITSNDED